MSSPARLSPEPATETFIRPPQRFRSLDLSEIWTYRDLLVSLSWRHIQVRYKQAVLGGLWAILQPAAAAVAFTLVFRGIVGDTDGVPYMVFAFTGMVLWQLVAAVVGSGATSMVDDAPLITKVYFPRLIVPLAVVGFSLVDLLLGLVVLAVIMAWFGVVPGLAVLLLPVAVVGTLVCAVGTAVLLAALTIKYRDFRFVVPFFLQIWFFLTPVIYPSSRLPTWLASVLVANPMNGWICLLRGGVVGTPVDLTAVAVAAAVSGAVLVVGAFYFRHVEVGFADIV